MPKVNWAEINRPSNGRQKENKKSPNPNSPLGADDCDLEDDVSLEFEEQLSLDKMRKRISSKSRRRED